MPTLTKFDFSEISAVRNRVSKEINLGGGNDIPAHGWSIDPGEPGKWVAAFPCLQLKPGYTLRAYRYFWGNGGHGVVWAMPADAPFPEPKMITKTSLLPMGWLGRLFGSTPVQQSSVEAPGPRDIPKPEHAVPVASVLTGDGSAWSYLCASIVLRQIESFGQRWHNTTWPSHSLIDTNPLGKYMKKDPWTNASAAPAEQIGRFAFPFNWTALDAQPENWCPTVDCGSAITVTFFTYFGKMREGIYRHLDTYKTGSYSPHQETKKIAEGMGGYVN